MVVNEHQSVPLIKEEVKLLMGNGVSRQQITDAFEALREQRLVDAFIYREAEQDYQRYRRAKLKAGANLWWYANDAGRRTNAADS